MYVKSDVLLKQQVNIDTCVIHDTVSPMIGRPKLPGGSGRWDSGDDGSSADLRL